MENWLADHEINGIYLFIVLVIFVQNISIIVFPGVEKYDLAQARRVCRELCLHISAGSRDARPFVSRTQQISEGEKYFVLIKEHSYQHYCQLYVMANVAEVSIKKIAREQCRVEEKYFYGRLESFRVTGSLMEKNTVRKLVFFSDEVGFTLSRNVSGQSNRPPCYSHPLALDAVFFT